MSTVLSRGHWLSLGIGAALCGFAATGPRLFPVSSPGIAIEARRTERAALSLNDDATKRDLATRFDALQKHEWSPLRMEASKTRDGPEWRLSSDTGEGGYRLVILEAVNMPLTEWPALVELVAELERQYGLTIAGAEIRAAGSGPVRRFITVRLSFRVYMAR